MPTLYTETAFQIKPSTPTSIVTVQVPSHDGLYRRPKHPIVSPSSVREEKTFAKQYLASQSSVYFRQHKTYPRSFAWKVVQDEHVLQIQCADLARPAADLQEAHLTLEFEFPHAILPYGIALSDHDQGDAIFVFVITAKKELHTLALSTAFFRGQEDLSQNTRKWCSTTVPSSFSIDYPHRLVAATPFELFISYDSGRLQRLSRTTKDPSNWLQTNYDDRPWGASIRTIFKPSNSIQYAGRLLERQTAHAITISADLMYAYTVCLDHNLRIWNLETGKLVITKDLLDKPRQPQDVIQINPAEDAVIRLVKSDFMSHPILLTYSNHEGGQFKIWDLKGGLINALYIEDKYPAMTLVPPDPDPSGNIVWSMTGFDIVPGNNYKQSEMWILWRNNNYHQLYSFNFDWTTLEESWQANWVLTSTKATSKLNSPDFVRSDAEDPTAKWLAYLFTPDRYPSAVLETALSIFEDPVTSRTSVSKKDKSLQERLALTIASGVILRKLPGGEVDYDRFNSDTDQQWRNFWGTVQHIDTGRHAPVALSIDALAGMAWIVNADECCVVRECSKTELLLFNDADGLEAVETISSERWPYRRVEINGRSSASKISGLIRTAAAFRKTFSPELVREISCALDEELLHDPEFPASYRLDDFYERVNFGDLISNETFDQVEKDISQFGGFIALDDELFFAIIDTIPQGMNEEQSALRTTLFGSVVITAGMHDTIVQGRQLIFDLLMLLIFLSGELAQDDGTALPFDGPKLFKHMLGLLREYEKKSWLISHTRLIPLEFLGPDTAQNRGRHNQEVSTSDGRLVTIMEDIFAKAIRPRPITEKPQSFLLTSMLEDIQSWADGGDAISPEDGLVFIQADLINHKNVDLATDFLRFQPSTAWATYMKGRLHLARLEFETAVRYFQKASYSMACGRAVGSLVDMSTGLIARDEVDCFYNGVSRYFQHILTLFDNAKAYTQAAYIARLALQTLPAGQKEPVSNFRSEVLSRLFTAELKLSRFLSAFDALIQFTDVELQEKYLISLVTALIDPSTSITNISGALQILRQLPVNMSPHLARSLDSHLYALAKTQTTTPASASPFGPSSAQVDYLKLLHAYRISSNDYRGAVAVLLDRLRLIRKSNRARSDPEATEMRHTLLATINAMSCVAPDEAYVLTEAPEQQMSNGDKGSVNADSRDEATGWKKRKRIIVTLEDLRKEYQSVLDRCDRIERGDFDFGVDEDNEDEDEDMTT